MRIERHQVEEAALANAREDFADRIGSTVNSMSKAGLMGTSDWEMISEDLLDHLAAHSADHPDLDTAEAKAVLADASEAAAGMVAFAAYFPLCSFSIFLNYVNFGMTYDPGMDGERESVSVFGWCDAFCLTVLTDTTARHGEAFRFALETARTGKAGQPGAELAAGLMAYVLGVTDDDDAPWPLPPEDTLAALDAALARVERREHPDALALRGLRALAAGDREEFDYALTALLRHTAELGGSSPRSLLPLAPLALAALARRDQGWEPPVETGYLPRALVTGFESAGPRVGGLGRDRRPDAVAELAAGPVTVERPEREVIFNQEAVDLFEQFVEEARTPAKGGKPGPIVDLARAFEYLGTLFDYRAQLSADGTEEQLHDARRASQFGAALFRTMLAEPGTELEVTLDGAALRYPAHDGRESQPRHWQSAVNFALITGVREDLAPLVLSGPGRLHGNADRSAPAFRSYRRALYAYLSAEGDPEPAVERAVRDCGKAEGQGFLPPPAVLLSQLVEGDETSFNLALLDALEAHRDHYSVGDRSRDKWSQLDPDILALACHARRRGWRIRVVSPYLPRRVMESGDRR